MNNSPPPQNLVSIASYEPGVSLYYDEGRSLYIGEINGYRGRIPLEATSLQLLLNNIEYELAQDSMELYRDIEQEKNTSLTKGACHAAAAASIVATRSVYSATSSSASLAAQRASSAPILPHSATRRRPAKRAPHNIKKRFSKRNSGKIIEIRTATGQRKFAIIFCGVMLVAGSKGALKKKYLRARNRRIHHIMMHVRDHAHNLELTKKRKAAHKRIIQAKKESALNTWESRLGSTGRHMSVEKRIDAIKKGLEDKKEIARGWEP